MTAVCALLIAAAVLGACSNKVNTGQAVTTTTTDSATGSTTATTAPATNTTVAAVTDASVAPKVLAILTTLASNSNAANNDTSVSQVESLAATAFNTAAQQLQALQYPSNAQADAATLIKQFEVISADAAVGNISQYETDAATAHATGDSLRHDLGLPPAAS